MGVLAFRSLRTGGKTALLGTRWIAKAIGGARTLGRAQ